MFLLFHSGTPGFWPPEWIQEGEYYAYPATTWSLGVLLFSLVCGKMPFNNDEEIVGGTLNFIPGLSKCEKMQQYHIEILHKAENLREMMLNCKQNLKSSDNFCLQSHCYLHSLSPSDQVVLGTGPYQTAKPQADQRTQVVHKRPSIPGSGECGKTDQTYLI